MDHQTAIDGVSIEAAVRTFSPEVMQILADTNRVLNGFVGLTILIAIILLFLHVLRWAVYGSHSDTGKAAIAGAVRAFVAIFFMVDIWAIMRLIQRVTDISPAVAYVVLIFGAVLLCAWSLLGIGDLVITSMIEAVHVFIDRSVRRIRAIRHPSRIVKYVQSKNDPVLRFFVLISMAAAVTVLGLIWSFTGHNSTQRPIVFKDTPPISEAVGALPLTHGEGDAGITGTTYTNRHYGISITYPDGWVLEESTSSNALLIAYKPGTELFSELNAGIFEDTIDGSRDAYLRGMWRVQRYIFDGFSQQSGGVLSSDTVDYDDIGYSSSTRISTQSFWRFESGDFERVRDTYVVFRNNPVFFTLQVRAWGNTTDEEYVQTLHDIADSITLTGLTD